MATSRRLIAPKGQLAELIEEVFPAVRNKTGWVLVEGNVPGLEGLFLILTPDLAQMDGAALTSLVHRQFVIPVVEDAEVSLVNPSDRQAGYKIEYVDESGAVVASVEDLIPPQGRSVMHANALRPFAHKGGYLRGQSSGVAVLSVFGNAFWTAALSAINTEPLQSDALEQALRPSIRYSPRFVSGGGFSSTLDLVNLERAPLVLSLKLIGDNGRQIGSNAVLSIPSQGSTRISGTAVFGITSAELVQGYVRIESAAGQFVGAVTFTDTAGVHFGCALPLAGSGQASTFFSQVAQDDLFFTGAAILNPGEAAAEVTVTVYDTAGTRVASGSHSIPAGGRISKVLPELVGSLPPLTKGYFEVRSGTPVVTFALFGTNALEALSAIPPAGN